MHDRAVGLTVLQSTANVTQYVHSVKLSLECKPAMTLYPLFTISRVTNLPMYPVGPKTATVTSSGFLSLRLSVLSAAGMDGADILTTNRFDPLLVKPRVDWPKRLLLLVNESLVPPTNGPTDFTAPVAGRNATGSRAACETTSMAILENPGLTRGR